MLNSKVVDYVNFILRAAELKKCKIEEVSNHSLDCFCRLSWIIIVLLRFCGFQGSRCSLNLEVVRNISVCTEHNFQSLGVDANKKLVIYVLCNHLYIWCNLMLWAIYITPLLKGSQSLEGWSNCWQLVGVNVEDDDVLLGFGIKNDNWKFDNVNDWGKHSREFTCCKG